MTTSHVLKYHLLFPAVVFAVALALGAPIGTAFVVGMMTGCMSMMAMMMTGSHHRSDRERDDSVEHR